MRIKSGLKSSFLAGLALLAPVVLTVFIVNTVANWILGALAPIVQETRFERITGDFLLAQVAVGVIAVVLVILIGFVAQYSVGRRMFGRAGRVMNFIPVVRTIYSSIRQVATSVSNRTSEFKSVVLVEYPREGAYSLGLVTAESPDAAANLAGGPVYNVFFPSSPNPTGGKLVMVPAEQVYETDMSVRRGIQILMTTGMAEDETAIEFDEEETLADASEGMPGTRHIDDLREDDEDHDHEEDGDREGE